MVDEEITPNYRFFINAMEARRHLISIRERERGRGHAHILRRLELYVRHSAGIYLPETGETYIFLYNWRRFSNPLGKIRDLFESTASKFDDEIRMRRDGRFKEMAVRFVLDTVNHEFFHQLLDQYFEMEKSSIREMFHVEKILRELEVIQEYQGPFTESTRARRS